MKRRDFIVATTGLAGAMVSGLARAQIKPCPPESFGISGAGSISTSCAPAGAAPSWFVDMAERQWTPVAGSAGERLIDVRANQALGFGSEFSSMINAWTGGCVDQERGELLFAANGGHTDYAGNEVYACSIRSERPQWYRLTDPSPASAVKAALAADQSTSSTATAQGINPNGFAAMYGDGRMRAVHGWHSVQFANGKVWYPHQSSPAGVGNSTPHAWVFNRDAAGIPNSPGGTPLGWQNNPGPWAWLGSTHTGLKTVDARAEGFYVAPSSAYDPISKNIWTVEGSAARLWSSLNTKSGTITGSPIYPSSDNTGSDGMWAAVVRDPDDRWRFFVVPARYRDGLHILNLKAENPYADGAWATVPVSDPTVLTGVVGCGAVYHLPSRAILLGNPIGNYSAFGGDLLKIRVPTNSDGSYAGGTWQVSKITPAAGSANPASGVAGTPPNSQQQGAWGKFNMIEDMGNGQSALVVCCAVDGPTYVYKLPSQGV